MITPTILHESAYGKCNFFGGTPDGYTSKESDFIINSLPAEDNIIDGTQYGRKVWVAMRGSGVWHVEQAELRHSGGYIEVTCFDKESRDSYAFPIDPRMTRADIEGATEIYANADNTGWLFSHAEVAHHHERIITLESAMVTLFADLEHERLEDVLKVVVGSANPSPPIGTALLYTYNAQLGELSKYSNLVDFRQECVKWCSELEKLLHVGQHVQQDDLYLQHQLVRAIEQAKAIYNADTGKARILASISSEVDAIIARVKTEHVIETRWDKAKRIADEAAKRAAAESNSDSGSEDTSQ